MNLVWCEQCRHSHDPASACLLDCEDCAADLVDEAVEFIRVADLEPRYQFVCEHPDDNRGELLTLRTESGERFCLDHFPWHSDDEQRHVLEQLRLMLAVVEPTDECSCWHNRRGELIYVETACPVHRGGAS